MYESSLQERLGSHEGRSETEKDVVTSCFPFQERGSNAVFCLEPQSMIYCIRSFEQINVEHHDTYG